MQGDSARCWKCGGEHGDRECPLYRSAIRTGSAEPAVMPPPFNNNNATSTSAFALFQWSNADGKLASSKTTTTMDYSPWGLLCSRCSSSGHLALDCDIPPICSTCGRVNCDCCNWGEYSLALNQSRIGGHSSNSGQRRVQSPQDTADIGPNYYSLVSEAEFHLLYGKKSFTELDLDDRLYENVKGAGYEAPMPVQRYAIPIIIQGTDVLALAQTGSGKTAAYLIPIFDKLLKYRQHGSTEDDVQRPFALILCPTRELCTQIYFETLRFSQKTAVRSCQLYGKTSMDDQLEQLRRGCEILVACPGRLLDFLAKGYVRLDRLEMLILDEADRMLDQGFEGDIRRIFAESPCEKGMFQRAFFSATCPMEISQLCQDFLSPDYCKFSCGPASGANADVLQEFECVISNHKTSRLVEILKERAMETNMAKAKILSMEKTLIFVERKRNAELVTSRLLQENLPATSMHSDRTQAQREQALAEFRSGQRSILVATEVAARGLDIRGIQCVINYDLPPRIETYIHRIGRTGRVGNQGRATSFFDPEIDGPLAEHLVQVLRDVHQEPPEWMLRYANAHY